MSWLQPSMRHEGFPGSGPRAVRRRSTDPTSNIWRLEQLDRRPLQGGTMAQQSGPMFSRELDEVRVVVLL